jgi:signal transduction histidine kinase
VLAATPAAAEDVGLRLLTLALPAKLETMRFDLSGPLGMLLIGLAIFAATIAILHVRARRLWNEQFEKQRATIADLQVRAERAALFMGAESQFLIAWDGPGGQAEMEGDPAILGEAMTAMRVLSFEDWVRPDDLARIGEAVDRLRSSGQGFNLQIHSRAGANIEADGQPVSGRAVLRLRAVTGARNELISVSERLQGLDGFVAAIKGMLDSVPHPVWLRDAGGQLRWVNAAYVAAVEARDSDDVVARGLDLMEQPTRDAVARARASAQPYRGTSQVVVAGARRSMDIIDVATGEGCSGGVAVDVTALENAKRDVDEQSAAHVRTLDQMPTAVALFDRAQRLAFFNRAFNELWQLDPRFLASQPTDMELLDRLRADGKLPEQSDFRAWKQGLQQSFHSNETLEDVWLLPSGRSLRVVTSPSTLGGVTYLFEDITEEMHLKQDYNRLASMQGETLDALAEGVAVFGTNGRLQLRNPAFAGLWGVQPETLGPNPHIDDVARLCPPESQKVWADMRATVCGMPDERTIRAFEARNNGKVLQLLLTPLPEGAWLLTVEDVTSTVNAARMLSERNQALESASRFKTEFIHNVSFELRMPLTSVVGIAQLLATGTAGPLNERQRGYANDLMRATDSVLALINDILDLASIDSSRLDLKIARIELQKSIEEASAGLRDRLGGAGVNLRLAIGPDIGVLLGDERRIKQILFNLMANAIAWSDPGDTVLLAAERKSDRIVLRVIDRGPTAGKGRPDDEANRRIERGQSMRLSIVRSLVELHHGDLTVEARPDGLRQVICVMPAAPGAPGAAAAAAG